MYKIYCWIWDGEYGENKALGSLIVRVRCFCWLLQITKMEFVEDNSKSCRIWW